MRVELLSWTSEPELIAKIAARTCYSEKSPIEMSGEKFPDLSELVERGHTSILEHAVFTFAIEGISRVCSHQLVRHRVASYSQQSQRIVKPGNYVVPPSVRDSKEAGEIFERSVRHSLEMFEKLTELGVPMEDGRYVLPGCMWTNIIVTMNARALLNFFRFRCCLRAQWEVRELANRMLKLVRDKMPSVFGKAGAPCKSEGVCPERKTDCEWYVFVTRKKAKREL